MKHLTIHIPENKFSLVLNLLQDLNYVEIDTPKDTWIISEEQKALVNDEFRKIDADPGYLLDWDDVKSQLNID